jgi:hypothetical protein
VQYRCEKKSFNGMPRHEAPSSSSSIACNSATCDASSIVANGKPKRVRFSSSRRETEAPCFLQRRQTRIAVIVAAVVREFPVDSAATGICGGSLRCGTMHAHRDVSARHYTASQKLTRTA